MNKRYVAKRRDTSITVGIFYSLIDAFEYWYKHQDVSVVSQQERGRKWVDMGNLAFDIQPTLEDVAAVVVEAHEKVEHHPFEKTRDED